MQLLKKNQNLFCSLEYDCIYAEMSKKILRHILAENSTTVFTVQCNEKGKNKKEGTTTKVKI